MKGRGINYLALFIYDKVINNSYILENMNSGGEYEKITISIFYVSFFCIYSRLL